MGRFQIVPNDFAHQLEQKIHTMKILDQIIDDSIPYIEKTGYLEARQKCPHLIYIESNPLWFVQYEQWNLWNAAIRLVKYWEWKRVAFGDYRTFLPLSDLSGITGALDESDVALVRTGAFTLLPNDRYGNTVLFFDRYRMINPIWNELSTEQKTRFTMYCFWTCVCDYYNRQQQQQQQLNHSAYSPWMTLDDDANDRDPPTGLVTLTLINGYIQIPSRNFSDMVREALPIHIVRTDMLFYPVDSDMFSFSRYIVPFVLRSHAPLLQRKFNVKPYCSSDAKGIGLYLETMGLSLDSIPPRIGGYWSFDSFTQLVGHATTGSSACNSSSSIRSKEKECQSSEESQKQLYNISATNQNSGAITVTRMMNNNGVPAVEVGLVQGTSTSSLSSFGTATNGSLLQVGAQQQSNVDSACALLSNVMMTNHTMYQQNNYVATTQRQAPLLMEEELRFLLSLHNSNDRPLSSKSKKQQEKSVVEEEVCMEKALLEELADATDESVARTLPEIIVDESILLRPRTDYVTNVGDSYHYPMQVQPQHNLVPLELQEVNARCAPEPNHMLSLLNDIDFEHLFDEQHQQSDGTKDPLLQHHSIEQQHHKQSCRDVNQNPNNISINPYCHEAAVPNTPYWNVRKRIFGQRFMLPMDQTGLGTLSPDDVEAINAGFLMMLPKTRMGQYVLSYEPIKSRLYSKLTSATKTSTTTNTKKNISNNTTSLFDIHRKQWFYYLDMIRLLDQLHQQLRNETSRSLPANMKVDENETKKKIQLVVLVFLDEEVVNNDNGKNNTIADIIECMSEFIEVTRIHVFLSPIGLGWFSYQENAKQNVITFFTKTHDCNVTNTDVIEEKMEFHTLPGVLPEYAATIPFTTTVAPSVLNGVGVDSNKQTTTATGDEQNESGNDLCDALSIVFHFNIKHLPERIGGGWTHSCFEQSQRLLLHSQQQQENH